WLDTFGREAAARGISARTVQSALSGITHDPRVVRLDRRQGGTFRKSFEEFAASRITKGRLSKGASLMRRHARLLERIERQFGVPPAVIVAIWGLETDFGANMGNHSALRALATLAHDCRRTDMFQRELMAALAIIDRGDLSPRQMVGAWAGELGQTQFLASSYERFAVDYDGDGRRDLIRSVPDALASTANYLRAYGWRRGAGWQPGEANFNVLREWTRAAAYARTTPLLAARLAGPRSRHPPVAPAGRRWVTVPRSGGRGEMRRACRHIRPPRSTR